MEEQQSFTFILTPNLECTYYTEFSFSVRSKWLHNRYSDKLGDLGLYKR